VVSGGIRPGAQVLEAHQHDLFRHLKKKFFSRNLGQNIPKNAHFFRKKVVKLLQRPGDPPPNLRRLRTLPPDPALLLPLPDIDLSKVKVCFYRKAILLGCFEK